MVDRLKQEYAGSVEFVVYDEIRTDYRVSDFATAHDVRSVPTMVLVDREGRELDRRVGGCDEPKLRAFLDPAR